MDARPDPGADAAAAGALETWQIGGFGLYVHWPFCASKCPYCDFNSHVVASVDEARWREALLRDLRAWAERTPDRTLGSVFFGGGTPSLMAPDTVAAVVAEARALWRPANDLEVTLEANPSSVEAGRFAGYVDGGVNRFSLGVQALDDDALRALGRLHDVRQARAAFEVARSLVERVSFDLIYARQGQGLDAWRRELGEALLIAGEHLSLYQLTIEDGTAFGARHAAGRLPGLPPEDLAVSLYEATQELCAAAGLPRYETSNHARPGAECRHNLVYWRGGDWVGIGPGAHGRVTTGRDRLATEAERSPEAWLARNERNGTGASNLAPMSQTDWADEYVLMGLRLSDGIRLSRAAALGLRLEGHPLDHLIELGLLERGDDGLRTTEAGALLLDSILAELLAGAAREARADPVEVLERGVADRDAARARRAVMVDRDG